MRLLPLFAFAALLFCHFVRAEEGDLIELLIVPVGKEMKLFSETPQIQSASVKDRKATISKLNQLFDTDYVSGYTFVADVREQSSRGLDGMAASFFITYSFPAGFIDFGEGQRSPLITTGNLWDRLPATALNDGWYSFELKIPQAVYRQTGGDEPKPAKLGAILFVRWSRQAIAE